MVNAMISAKEKGQLPAQLFEALSFRAWNGKKMAE